MKIKRVDLDIPTVHLIGVPKGENGEEEINTRRSFPRVERDMSLF